MATTGAKQQRKMKCMFIFKFLLSLSFFQAVYKVDGIVEGHAQAFIQTDNDLQYIVDGVSIQMHQGIVSENSVSFTDASHEDNIHSHANIISFHPPFLDFKIQPIGIPFIKKVIVHNPSAVSSINMLSISGSTVHFHCSFFLEKVIEPGGNTSFDVVFLSRETGPIENTLFIHTSIGSFGYKVHGEGAPNPYKLRPFLGVRVPLNSSYNPLIKMHNPYGITLQITEMYSSGGDLHLELVSGESEAPVDLWAIKPFETKSIMRASFIARKESNHTAYIRIKTNSSGEPYLVIPVEVEVSSEPGIYSPVEVLDFGVIRSYDNEIRLTLNLLNAGNKPIHITNVISTPVNEALKINFKSLKISPDTFHPTEVATLIFLPSKVQSIKQCSGKIVVKSKNNQFKISVPYIVNLLHGSLQYNSSLLQFFISPFNMSYTRVLNVKNLFNTTVVIFNVSLNLEAKPYFQVLNFQKTILKPGQSCNILKIKFETEESNLQLSTHLRLHTNISKFDFPLTCYTGKLNPIISQNDKNEIEFGTLGMGEKRVMTFKLHNKNNIQVQINFWSTNRTKTVLKCVSIIKNDSSMRNVSTTNKTIILEPSDIAIFQVSVTAPNVQGKYYGLALIKTLFEIIKLPFSFTAAKGSLNSVPQVISFLENFPGKVSFQPLNIQSTFSQPLEISKIEASFPFESLFYFEPTNNILKPESTTYIGNLIFDPKKFCGDDCFSSFLMSSNKGEKWVQGMALNSDVGELDKELYQSLRSTWQEIEKSQRDSLNVTLRLDTEDVQGFLLQSRVQMTWPMFSTRSKIKFPLTQIGNTSVKELVLQNPASTIVFVQIVTLPAYPSQDIVLDILKNLTSDKLEGNIEKNNKDLFHLMDLDLHEENKDRVKSYKSKMEEFFQRKSNDNSLVLLLIPGKKYRLRIRFSPTNDQLTSSVILLRNNLTSLETIVIEGQGGYGEMKLGNKEPGLKSILLLEMTEKHLGDCERDNNHLKAFPSRFTVKRSFTARNTGKLPIFIKSLYISDSPCQGYGFRILNCHSFNLLPNSSHKLDIAFTPDFTLTRVERILSIETSLSEIGQPLNYSLVATIPASMLSACAQALPRSQWEPFLYYSVICFMIFLLFCIFATAYFESDRILRSTYVAMAVTSPITNPDNSLEKPKVFDLKTLGSKSFSNKVQSSKKVEKIKSTNDKKEKSDKSYIFPINLFLRKRNKSPKLNSDALKPFEDGVSYNVPDGIDVSEALSSASKLLNGDISDLKYSTNAKKKTSKNEDAGSCIQKDDGNTHDKSLTSKSSWSNIFKSPSNKISNEENAKNLVNNKTSKPESKDEFGYYSTNQIIEIMDKDISSKWSTKVKSKKKSKVNSSSNQDMEVNKSIIKKSINCEEETSSTSTETSNPDSDNNIDKESKPKVEKTKSKARLSNKNSALINKFDNKMVSVKGVDDDDANSADFELSSKSKAHKKIKIDSSKVYGGDVLKPSTLELPYKLKPIKLNKDKENKNGKVKESGPQKSSKSKVKNISSEASLSNSNLNKSSSYSSIVSNNGSTKNNKASKKSENKHPGPIGQKPCGSSAKAWSLSNSSPTKMNKMSNSDCIDTFFLPTVHETPIASQDGGIPSLNSLNFGSNVEYPQTDNFNSYPSATPWNGVRTKPLTMMQSLQAERRQRMEEYRKQQTYKTDWPGFENSFSHDNLWDSSYPLPNSDAHYNNWSSSSVNQVDAQTDNSWNGIKTNSWNPVSSIWPSTSSSNDSKGSLMDGVKHKPDDEKHGYNPFHNLSSIWSPAHSQPSGISSTENAWSNSFFTDKTHPDKD